MLFTFGYGYVATLVASEQLAGRRSVAAAALAGQAPDSARTPESFPGATPSVEELAA
jgi:hypothetical protein